MATVRTPLDASWHLRAELSGLLTSLARYLEGQRRRGRTPAGDVVRALVIEEGEAEGLLAELMTDWTEAGHFTRPRRLGPAAESEPAARAAAEVAQGAYLPLRHAAATFALSPEEHDALLLALAVELDARFGRLVAFLNDHVAQTRPTVGLAVAVAAIRERMAVVPPWTLVMRPLVRDGLIELEGDGPLPGRALRIAPEMVRRFTADRPLDPEDQGVVAFYPVEVGLLKRLVLTDEVRQRLEVWAGDLRSGADAPRLILAGAPTGGRTTLARAAASAAGLPLVTIEVSAATIADRLRLARREARWYRSAALLQADDPALDWRALWHECRGMAAPLVITVPSDAAERAFGAARGNIALIRLEDPGTEERRELWRALLPRGVEIDAAALDAIATGFKFTPGRIAAGVRRAGAELALRPRGERRLSGEALRRAAREIGAAGMGHLAQRLPLPYARDDLVVPPQLDAELDLALAWVREERRVLDQWGFGRRLPFGRGLTALFAGPPGTGKTMAAQVLAHALGLEIYRVDLARVVSKYIGETEKHLAQLFEEARSAGVVLFFDEADALFGKRSEVRDAHDRYANIEIGYLLLRMEEHDGVLVLATNRRQDLDEAFVRRFDVVLEFPMPGEADRLRIWRGMLTPEVECEPDLDLAALARKFELSGGEIRNAVLAAAYMAAAEGRPLAMRHLTRALRRELIKSGRAFDEGDLGDL